MDWVKKIEMEGCGEEEEVQVCEVEDCGLEIICEGTDNENNVRGFEGNGWEENNGFVLDGGMTL